MKRVSLIIFSLFLVNQLFAQFDRQKIRDEYNRLYGIQPELADTLDILMEDGTWIHIYTPRGTNLQETDSWRELLSDFQTDLRKIEQDLPDYDLFRIYYAQGQTLTMDELEGREIYSVNEQGLEELAATQTCVLIGPNISMHIEIHQINDAFDPEISQTIAQAIAAIKYKKGYRKWSTVGLSERLTFDSKLNAIQKPEKNKPVYFSTVGAHVLFYDAVPITELRVGFGFLYGRRRNMIFLSQSMLTQYNSQTQEAHFSTVIALNLYTYGKFGAELGWGGSFEEGLGAWRLGLKYRSSQDMVFGAYYLVKATPNEFDFSGLAFSIGFGF